MVIEMVQIWWGTYEQIIRTLLDRRNHFGHMNTEKLKSLTRYIYNK